MSFDIIKAEAKSITSKMFKARTSFSFSTPSGEMSDDIQFSKGLAMYLDEVENIVMKNKVDLTAAPYNSIDKASDGSVYLEYSFAPFVKFGKSPFILIKNDHGKVIAGFINMYKNTTSYCPVSYKKAVEAIVIKAMKEGVTTSYGEAQKQINENIATRNNPDNIPKITKTKDLLFFVDFENNVLWTNDSKNANRDIRRMTAMLRNFVNHFSDAEFKNIDKLTGLREQLFEGENVHLIDYPSYSTGMLKTVGAFNLHNTIAFFSKYSGDEGIVLTNTAKLSSYSNTKSTVAFNNSISDFVESDKDFDEGDDSFFTKLHKFAENKEMEIKELKVQGEVVLPQAARDYMATYQNTAFTESGLGNLIDVEFKLSDPDGKMKVELCKALHMKVFIEILIHSISAHFEDEVLNTDKAEIIILDSMSFIAEMFLEKSKLFIDTFHKTNAVEPEFGDLSKRFESGTAPT